ncbi:hypothetical protein ETSY2_51565 : Uncharacterized protein OS=Candidatus Entotheonella sp. TSY2 GN=ETSY2_51565 PE=4 SV=1: Asp_protease_2 [Gemmataceae bacterium]|nr:hypothetical protein ETSY2_51565 : Uncharacterized protein OS=Candidatus Entotheonella sp. TSY2 GN=ETSY2_51565 PE=4 SV=1: Asp_protease_2 [Gemmataceae bacterium]VTU02740.1 hypothetical protein ETSY2_51565 : Uncharacterized protein OS=Candidatus Entotheonella sp. TSY2 GN=ETSY2_51565 PE=4 SV=1: Asp_protease_2 [Gemmataceae bacterium]
MRINGFWHVGPDSTVRPIIPATALGSDGLPHDISLLVDTGADRTVLDFDTYVKLGLATKATGEFELEGVGGLSRSVIVPAQLQFTKAEGGTALVNIQLMALTEATSLGMNVLGRDFLSLFSVIVDRQGDTVCLLHGRHRYVIQES